MELQIAPAYPVPWMTKPGALSAIMEYFCIQLDRNEGSE